jgi:hypothetical protein
MLDLGNADIELIPRVSAIEHAGAPPQRPTSFASCACPTLTACA